ncbi:hypothetical protein HDU99_000115, partial [Rhizoclosmatium hyalinum]
QSLERFVQGGTDCVGGNPPVADPSAAKLKCLEFDLPATFSLVMNDRFPTKPVYLDILYSFLTFTDNSENCKGSDIVTRIQDVYGRIVQNPPLFFLDVHYNNTKAASTDSHFIKSMYAQFWIDPLQGSSAQPQLARRGGPGSSQCDIHWISTVVLSEETYVLANKNPICGPKAPKLLDNSVETLEQFSVTSYSDGSFSKLPSSALSQAYNVPSSSIIYQPALVTSDASSPSNDNSCVYEYLAQDRHVIVRNFTLQSYDLGGLPASTFNTPTDGCVSSFSIRVPSAYTFANQSSDCGDVTNPQARFVRYFSVPISVNFQYLDEMDGIFHVTVLPNSRRDGTSATFVYMDISLLPAATTSTIDLTSTASSSFASTDFSTFASTDSPTFASTDSSTFAFTSSFTFASTVMSSSTINDFTSQYSIIQSTSVSSIAASITTSVISSASSESASFTATSTGSLAKTASLPAMSSTKSVPISSSTVSFDLVSSKTIDSKTTTTASPTTVSEDITSFLALTQILSTNTVLPKYEGDLIQVIAKLNFKLPAALGNVDASKIFNSVFAITESVTPGKPIALAGPAIPSVNKNSGFNILALLVTPSGYSTSKFSAPSVNVCANA